MRRRLPLVLASASPRRTELLASIGLPHEVVPAEVDEPAPGSLPPYQLVEESARMKAESVARRLPGRLVLAADTVVWIALPEFEAATAGEARRANGGGDRRATWGEVLGKPAGPAEAREMLSRLDGRTHRVLSSVVLRSDARLAQATSTTEVCLGGLDEAFLARYVATGEPLDKAGAYGAQGFMGTQVRRVNGSWTNVVGLPLELLPALFAELGEAIADWQDW